MNTLLRRLMPDSLFKQISLTLLASIGLLFFVNMGVVFFIQSHFLGMLEKERSANIVSMYVLLSGVDTSHRNEVFNRIVKMQEGTSRHVLTFHLIKEAPSWTTVETYQTKQAISTLKDALTENNITPPPEVSVRLFLEGDNFQVDEWARQVSGSAPVCANPLLQVGVRLDATSWLNITQPLYQSAGWLLWVQRLIFFIEFAIFGGIVLLLLRRLIKPFQQLAQAAEQVGKQPEIASPVPETGCKEMREAAQSFNRMQVRIQDNLAERNRMLAAMAHDLRTPLTRVQLRIEEVEPEDLREKLIEDIKEVQSIAEQSLELSSSLKTSGKSVPLDICAFMQSSVDDFMDMGHTVTMLDMPEEGLAVMANPMSLKRCVDNILYNAIAYAGNAKVCVSSLDNDVTIEICDNGPGIPDEYLEKIFEPYFRLETSRNRESGGTGLGLSIAKNMIMLNNGSLTLENRSEGGLRARIILPRLNR